MSFHKILFLAEGQLGDLLLLTPALRAIKESFPSSLVSVLVVERRGEVAATEKTFEDLSVTPAEHGQSVLGSNPHVDQLLILNRESLRSLHGFARLNAEWKIVRFLRRQKFDTVVCTFPEDRFAEWAYASGASRRVGQRNQKLQWLLTHTPDIEKGSNGVLEYYCDLVRAIGVTVRSNVTEYVIPASSLEWAKGFFGVTKISAAEKLIAVHPGATGNYRIWPPERYAALINHLSKNNKVILLGGKLDEPIITAIRNHLQSSVLEIRTRGGNLAAILQRCSLCISNDSGPRHLAIAVGTPSLAFFRQHHDREWGVYDENDRLVTLKGSGKCPACPEGICLDKIPEGEKFSTYCIRMIEVDEAIVCAGKMARHN